MKSWFKKYGGLLYIGAATLFVVLVLVLSDEIPVILETLSRLDVRFVWASGLCVLAYLTVRSATLMLYLRSQNQRIRWRDAAYTTAVGQFYSAITPSASGGQPMQVVALHDRGVPVSVATAAVSLKFIGFELAVILLACGLWAINAPFISTQLYGFRWLIVVGLCVNGLVLIAVLLTIKKSRTVDALLNKCVSVGAKLRLIRDPNKTRARAHDVLDEYRLALVTVIERKWDALAILLLSILQIVFYMGISVCLYHAFHLNGIRDDQVFTLQTLLFVMASFVPLPGAAGAQEGGFYLFFHGLVPDANLLSMMVCWRFFTYYLLMIVGLVGVVAGKIADMLRRRREERHDG